MGFAYRIASPSEYLAITGYGIDDVKLAKKVWVAPGQHCTRFDISPVNYTFEVQAMSAEKISFILPAVIVVGPQADDMECLLRYAKLISPHDKLSDHVNGLVKGVIEGEVRVLAASMTMEQIFQNTKSFKRAVFESMQLELNKFGLLIYNFTVKQLMDVPGHDYFSYQGQKMFASEREAEGNARLAMNKAGLEQKVKVAEVEAHLALAIREALLQGEVERANAARETEKLKGEHLSKAIVDYEMKVQQANWELYVRQKAAEALLFEQEKEAEARRASADAAFFARQREAEAEFYAKQKEAEGLMAMGKAHGAYLVATHALGGSYGVEGIEPMTVLGVNGRATADGGTGGDDSATARVHQMLASVHQQTARLPTTWKILVRALVYAFFVCAVYIRINYQ